MELQNTKMKMIVGLGNPGSQYENTRHNFGFMVLDRIAEDWKFDITIKKGSYIYGILDKNNSIETKSSVVFCKPICFMNNSGIAVRQGMKYFERNIPDLLIIYDDIDLPLGKVRVRDNGSAGGHRGIQSIIEKISSRTFTRLKLGIGPQPKGTPAEDFVLEDFNKDKIVLKNEVIEKSVSIVKDFINNIEITNLMQKYNGNALNIVENENITT